MKFLKAFYHLVETAGETLVELRRTNKKLDRLIMNQAELAQALADLGAQLVKALDEIVKAIQNAGNVTPEVQAALDNAKAIAQQLDDLNPDEVPPQP